MKRYLLMNVAVTKRVLLMLILIFSILPSAQAQDIVGKWKCPKEYLHSLGTCYVKMRGYYKFNKDGTFVVKIHGSGLRLSKGPHGVSPFRSIYIKVKGTYCIADNAITTIVRPEGVSCFVDAGMPSPIMPTAYEENTRTMANYNFKNRHHEQGLTESTA